MTLNTLQTAGIIEIMEDFLRRRRPPKELRNQVDLGYKIEVQSVTIYEIRSYYADPRKMIESPIAKATYIKAKGNWKVFWQKSDLKWHSFTPMPTVGNLSKFIDLVDKDEYGCFFG